MFNFVSLFNSINITLGADVHESDEFMNVVFIPAFYEALTADFPSSDIDVDFQSDTINLFKVVATTESGADFDTDALHEVITDIYARVMESL
jgi:hypothetical protein